MGVIEETGRNMDEKDDALAKRQKTRGHWKRPIEFILSLVGFSVGLSSIWRFPYLAMRNGGGAFLIPYVLFAITVGIPVVFMETALGQYFQLSPLLIFDMCPLFKGLGISMTILAFVGYMYYMVILAWTLYYLAMSFMPTLPWTTCDNLWNTNSCVPLFAEESNDFANVTIMAAKADNSSGVLATEEYWRYNVLDISSGIDDPGVIRWQLLIPLIISYGLVYLCIFKGVDSSRIAVYITATAPFVILLIFFAWLLTRPGSSQGLLYYVTPRWERIIAFETWLEAFLHVFYSLGPCWGGLINLASYNPFNHNCYRASVVVVVLDVITAILCGAVVFAGVGCIAYQTGTPFTEVITAGPGLSFMTYPQVVALFPVPHFWAVCFFLLILFLGLDSQFAMVKTLTSAMTDLYPDTLGRRKYLAVFVVIVISLLLSLPFITRGGVYIFHIVDWYASFFTILLIAFIESIVIGWLYDGERFLRNCREMCPFDHQWILQFMKICWKFIIPLCMMTALVVAMVKFRSPSYGDYTYPDWTNVFGWLLAVSSSLPIPVLMVYVLLKLKGTLTERLKLSIRPRIGRMGQWKEDISDDEGTPWVGDIVEEVEMLDMNKQKSP